MLSRISRVLPERLARRVERLRGELTLSGEPHPAPVSSETLLLVAEAVRRRRTLRIHYTRRDGARSTREIDPFGLVARRGCWYVPARDHASGELRTFRADRMTRTSIGAPAAPAEPGFDPADHVVQMLARLPLAWEIEVRVDAPMHELAGRLPPTLAQLAADGDATRLTMRADSLEWVAGILAGLRGDFAVIRPAELRDEVAQLAARLARNSQRVTAVDAQGA